MQVRSAKEGDYLINQSTDEFYRSSAEASWRCVFKNQTIKQLKGTFETCLSRHRAVCILDTRLNQHGPLQLARPC